MSRAAGERAVWVDAAIRFPGFMHAFKQPFREIRIDDFRRGWTLLGRFWSGAIIGRQPVAFGRSDDGPKGGIIYFWCHVQILMHWESMRGALFTLRELRQERGNGSGSPHGSAHPHSEALSNGGNMG